MFCPNCGNKIEGVKKFCTQCGAQLESGVAVKKGGSSPWLKIVGIVGGVILVIVVIALLIGGTGGTSSPEQAIRTFYREAERLNASGQADLLAQEQYREMWSATLQMSYDMIESLSISNLTVTITSQTEDTAEATAEYDLWFKLKAGTVYPEEHEVDGFELVRVGNSWLIDETDFFYGDWS